MWETHGLMTRIDKAYFTTRCNRKLCSTIALTKEKLHMSLAPRFITGDVAQMVERSLCMWAVRGSMPRISNFSEEPGNQKKRNKGSCFVRPKHDMDLYVQYAKGSIWNSTELAEKALMAPGIVKFYLRKTSEETILYWRVNQRHPTGTNSSCGPHQRGISIGRATDWHVRNTGIDDPHRQRHFYNQMQ